MSEITEMKESILRIEKVLTAYCEARAVPIQTVNVTATMSKRKFNKFKKQFRKAKHD